jgi:hypothetical protein
MPSRKKDIMATVAVIVTRENIQSHIDKLTTDQFILLPVTPDNLDPSMLAKLTTEVASFTHEFTKARRAKKLKALVELLTSDVESPKTIFREAQMIARAQRAVLESAQWLTAAQLSSIAGFSASNPSVQPNKWKAKRQIFAIQIKGIDYFPEYALNPNDNYRPLKIVADILKVFDGSVDGWGAAYWFVSINGYLDDCAPQDLLKTKPQAVLEAAKRKVLGVCHG